MKYIEYKYFLSRYKKIYVSEGNKFSSLILTPITHIHIVNDLKIIRYIFNQLYGKGLFIYLQIVEKNN